MTSSDKLAAGTSLQPDQVGTALAGLANLDLGHLRSEWRRLFRAPPPKSFSHDLLQRDIAYRLQEFAYGGLSSSLQRALTKLAAGGGASGKQPAAAFKPRVRPGVTLVREWHGTTHTVQVLDSGFEHRGQRYASLTEIARQITGASWSGPRFFGLRRPAAAIAKTPRRAAKFGTHDG